MQDEEPEYDPEEQFQIERKLLLDIVSNRSNLGATSNDTLNQIRELRDRRK